MTHSQSDLRKSQVEPLGTICSLDKNASRLALLYEMLPRFQKKRHLWFWSDDVLISGFQISILLVASVKSYAKSAKAFALVFLQTVCISAWPSIIVIMK